MQDMLDTLVITVLVLCGLSALAAFVWFVIAVVGLGLWLTG